MTNIYIVVFQEIHVCNYSFHAAYVNEPDAKEETFRMNNKTHDDIVYWVMTAPLHGCNHPIEPS